jgi:hypothetical protein
LTREASLPFSFTPGETAKPALLEFPAVAGNPLKQGSSRADVLVGVDDAMEAASNPHDFQLALKEAQLV